VIDGWKLTSPQLAHVSDDRRGLGVQRGVLALRRWEGLLFSLVGRWSAGPAIASLRDRRHGSGRREYSWRASGRGSGPRLPSTRSLSRPSSAVPWAIAMVLLPPQLASTSKPVLDDLQRNPHGQRSGEALGHCRQRKSSMMLLPYGIRLPSARSPISRRRCMLV